MKGRVTVVPIVIGAIWTVKKGSERGLEEVDIGGWIETIQFTELLRSAKILIRVLVTKGDSDSSETQPVKTGGKNSQEMK